MTDTLPHRRISLSSQSQYDPIEKFLRKVDTTSEDNSTKRINGYEMDTEGGSIPRLCQCSIKGKLCIFLPSAPGRLMWDVLVALMIIYYVIVVPMRLAFEPHNSTVDMITGRGAWLVLDIIFDLMFVTDILINFRTAYLVSGELETDSVQIAKTYCSGWFFLDMVASLPTTILTVIVNDGDDGNAEGGGGQTTDEYLQYNYIFRALKWFKLIKLIRVVRISRIFDRFEHITMLWNEGSITLVKSSMLLWFLWHVVACLYWIVSTSQGFCMWTFVENHTYVEYNTWDVTSGGQPNGFQECYDDWVPWGQIVEEPFSTQYAQAFFWAVMVTTGVGKDINPQSETETNFTIFVIGIGIIAYALLIGSLSTSLQSMAHKSKAHNAQLERINQFMQFNKVPRYMQIAIKQYYEFKWSRRDVDLSAVDDLPEMLKIRLKVMLNRDILYSVPVFRELPADCIIALTQHIRSATIFPQEYSVHQNQQNSMLFIIRHGRMKMTRRPIPTAKKRWKGILSKWSQNNRAKHASLANICFTAYRDTFVLAQEEKRSQEEFVCELFRGNFYGSNCLSTRKEPESYSVSAIVFTEVNYLDTSSDAMKLIMSEYPNMTRKLTEFAEARQRRILRQINQQKMDVNGRGSVLGSMGSEGIRIPVEGSIAKMRGLPDEQG